MDEIFEDMVNTAESYYQGMNLQEKSDRMNYPESWQAAGDDYELSEDVI